MITSKLLAIGLFPTGPNGQLGLIAQLANGALYGFVGIGSTRPELSLYDPSDWRQVQRMQHGVEAGKVAVIKTQFPFWEALPPVPGTDAYDADIKENGALATTFDPRA